MCSHKSLSANADNTCKWIYGESACTDDSNCKWDAIEAAPAAAEPILIKNNWVCGTGELQIGTVKSG
jgi:hypothetical protein